MLCDHKHERCSMPLGLVQREFDTEISERRAYSKTVFHSNIQHLRSKDSKMSQINYYINNRNMQLNLIASSLTDCIWDDPPTLLQHRWWHLCMGLDCSTIFFLSNQFKEFKGSQQKENWICKHSKQHRKSPPNTNARNFLIIPNEKHFYTPIL